MRLAETRQSTALRPGTQANHRSALTAFVTFLSRHGIDFRSPSDEIVCAYFEVCLKTAKSPLTIKNYASSLSSVYNRMGLDNAVFHSFRVRSALTSIDKNVRYQPTPSLPVTPAILTRVILIVSRLPQGHNLVLAYVLMFHTFFRVSNFAAPSRLLFDHTRQLTRDDVRIGSSSLRINHKWSKSNQSASHAATVLVPEIPNSPLCPKTAYIRMLNRNPTRSCRQPMLVFQDGNHIPSTYLRKVWNVVLSTTTIPNSNRYTLHGLRRGAATHVISQDPTLREDIKRHGMWKSDAVDRYLPASANKVFGVMRDSLKQ